MASRLGFWRIGLFGRFSRKCILSQRALCLERVAPARDEWAVKKGLSLKEYLFSWNSLDPELIIGYEIAKERINGNCAE
jgi:hypothetical protein